MMERHAAVLLLGSQRGSSQVAGRGLRHAVVVHDAVAACPPVPACIDAPPVAPQRRRASMLAQGARGDLHADAGKRLRPCRRPPDPRRFTQNGRVASQ
ncbi:hypothetical protein XarbCFBP7629_18830 [Xanthomonas arboricola]|nr:hypothetical protein XarbCFBP7629_18830 [Xanthomonas arboricola]